MSRIKPMILKRLILLFISSGLLLTQAYAEGPAALYLTWTHDPSNSMVVQWHTEVRDKISKVFYQKVGAEGWCKGEGNSKGLPGGEYRVHTVELTQLESDTEYQFKVGINSTVYRFRTMPEANTRPIRFVVGGDAYFYLTLFRKICQQIAKTDPDFVVVGGDIAYTQGHKSLFKGTNWEVKRWRTFFKEWKNEMVAPDGRLIPMVIVVGNHDVKKVRDNPRRAGVLFFDLFAMPEPYTAYRTLDFGSYLSLILLDTGHIHRVNGPQKTWLEEALKERSDVLYKMAVYHVAAYPSVYAYDSGVPQKLRRDWVPYFDEYGVQVAFENHNHAYKRTHRLKNNQIDETGVLYLGDGCWGVSPRKPRTAQKAWYLAETAVKNHFFLTTLIDGKCSIQAIDIYGQYLDISHNISPALIPVAQTAE